MKIVLITPASHRTRTGNRNTAKRWANLLRNLGHEVRIAVEWDDKPADAMLALHAKRSHDAIARFRARYPTRPILLALTGTDLYRDLPSDTDARQSIKLATALAVLQEEALKRLTRAQRERCVVVHQSALPVAPAAKPLNRFEVCVVGHLRDVKDPLRAAHALSRLPATSRIVLTQLGGAMESALADEAHALGKIQPRFRWLGELPHWRVRRVMARAHLMVISSLMEGGANVVSEALAADLPVIASRIPGNVGMLGPDYAGYFPAGNETALARLLHRAETDPAFYDTLQRQCRARKRLFTVARERAALKAWLGLAGRLAGKKG